MQEVNLFNKPQRNNQTFTFMRKQSRLNCGGLTHKLMVYSQLRYSTWFTHDSPFVLKKAIQLSLKLFHKSIKMKLENKQFI